MIAAIPGLALIAIWAACHITAGRLRVRAANKFIDRVTAELADFAAWEREGEEQWR